jgi:hypothetical protein
MAEYDAEFQRYLDFIEGVMPEQRTQRDPAKLQAEQDFLQNYFGATDYAAQEREARRMRNLQIGLSLMGRGFAGAGVRPERGEKPIAAFGRSVVAPLASDLMGITGQDYQNRMAREAAQAQEERALKLSALQNVQQRESAAYQGDLARRQMAMGMMRKDSTLLDNLTYDGERMPIIQTIDPITGEPFFSSITGEELDGRLVGVYTKGEGLPKPSTTALADNWEKIIRNEDGTIIGAEAVPVVRKTIYTPDAPEGVNSLWDASGDGTRYYTSGEAKNLQPAGTWADSQSTDAAELEHLSDYVLVDSASKALTAEQAGVGGNVPLVFKQYEQDGVIKQSVLMEDGTYKPWTAVLAENEPLANLVRDYRLKTLTDYDEKPTAADPIWDKDAIQNFTQAGTIFSTSPATGDRTGFTINPKAFVKHIRDGATGLYKPADGEPGLFEHKEGVPLTQDQQEHLETVFRSFVSKLDRSSEREPVQTAITRALRDFSQIGYSEVFGDGTIVATDAPTAPTVGEARAVDAVRYRELEELGSQNQPVADLANPDIPEGINVPNLDPRVRRRAFPILTGINYNPKLFAVDPNALDGGDKQLRLDVEAVAAAGGGEIAQGNLDSENRIAFGKAFTEYRGAREKEQTSETATAVKTSMVEQLNLLDDLDSIIAAASRVGWAEGPIAGRVAALQTAIGMGDRELNNLVTRMSLSANGIARMIGKQLNSGRLSDKDVEQQQNLAPNPYRAEDLNYSLLMQLRGTAERVLEGLMYESGHVAFNDNTNRRIAERGYHMQNVTPSLNYHSDWYKGQTTDALKADIGGMTLSKITPHRVNGVLDIISERRGDGNRYVLVPKYADVNNPRGDDDVINLRANDGENFSADLLLEQTSGELGRGNPTENVFAEIIPLEGEDGLLESFELYRKALALPPEILAGKTKEAIAARDAIEYWTGVWPRIKAMYTSVEKRPYYRRYFDRIDMKQLSPGTPN